MANLPPSEDSAPPMIHLTQMPQLAEATGRQDDWTGITDLAARRRAQTRLNMRAYRKRLAEAKRSKESGTDAGADAVVKSEDVVEVWDSQKECVCVVPASQVRRLRRGKRPLFTPQATMARRVVLPLSSDHLIVLQSFNALRGFTENRNLLSGVMGGLLDFREEDLVHLVPFPSDPSSVPTPLLPTLLQQTVPHGDWIDLFPVPEVRDRIIKLTALVNNSALAKATFDEDDLCSDCNPGLWEAAPQDEVERRGLVAWSPSWDIRGWEMSPGFVRKWGWLMEGVPGILEATNSWRAKRGERPLRYTSTWRERSGEETSSCTRVEEIA